MASVWFELSRREVEDSIPYAIVCETMHGSAWSTGRVKRMFADQFSEKERHACRQLKAQARRWYLETGVPETVKMKDSTYYLWQKLGQFCFEI